MKSPREPDIPVTIHTNDYGGKYYILSNIKYHISFPLTYALSHKRDTGPENCNNCASFGIIGNNIFLGYCANCAEEYNYSRGIGLNDNGVEFVRNDNSTYASANMEYDGKFIIFNKENEIQNSIYNTYLKGTTQEELLRQFPVSTSEYDESDGKEFTSCRCISSVNSYQSSVPDLYEQKKRELTEDYKRAVCEAYNLHIEDWDCNFDRPCILNNFYGRQKEAEEYEELQIDSIEQSDSKRTR